MAVKIRLTRMGDKHSPHYRLVAADSRCARDGKVIEALGFYNPMTNPAEVKINAERVQYWLGVGATPTDTAKELLVKEKLIKATKYVAPRPKQMPPAPKVKVEEPAKEEAPVETAPAEEVVVEAPAEEVVAEVAAAETPAE